MKKIGVKPLARALVVGAPPEIPALFEDGVQILRRAAGGLDAIVLFVTERGVLERRLPGLRARPQPAGMLWGASDSFNPAVVAQAADKTASAGGMKLAMTVSAQGQTLNGNGFLDAKGRKGRISLNLPQGNGTMDMVFLSRVIYMHLPDALSK